MSFPAAQREGAAVSASSEPTQALEAQDEAPSVSSPVKDVESILARHRADLRSTPLPLESRSSSRFGGCIRAHTSLGRSNANNGKAKIKESGKISASRSHAFGRIEGKKALSLF